MQATDQPGKLVASFLAGWLVLEIALASTGLLSRWPLTAAVGIPVDVCLLLLLVVCVKSLRESMATAPLWGFVLIHVFRLGAAVMFFAYRGNGLDSTWAFWTGWGDAAAAVVAVPVAMLACPSTKASQRRLLWTWNLFGLAVGVGGSAWALTLLGTATDRMFQLSRLPVMMVPACFLPIMLFSHIVITWRLLQQEGGSGAPCAVHL